MERWRSWGLTQDEWQDCVEAARELARLRARDAMTAEQIAAQLAVAKAAEERWTPVEPALRLDVR